MSKFFCVIVTAADGHHWPSCGGRLVGVQFYVRHEDACRESERLRSTSARATAVYDNFTNAAQARRYCRLLDSGVDAPEAVRLAIAGASQ
jgi:hypothetical protein